MRSRPGSTPLRQGMAARRSRLSIYQETGFKVLLNINLRKVLGVGEPMSNVN